MLSNQTGRYQVREQNTISGVIFVIADTVLGITFGMDFWYDVALKKAKILNMNDSDS